MTRRKLVAGNWKMNGSIAALAELETIAGAVEGTVDVAMAVPATLIAAAAARASGLEIGAEDVHEADCGAYTGCLSAAMIKEAGARFSIVGHSERRCHQHESDADVKGKAEALRRGGLWCILCVGEELADREAGRAEEVVREQVAGSLPDEAAGDWLAIAYEPVWAIGTGRTPTIGDVAAMHRAIRSAVHGRIGEEADRVRLLYGGSVTAENAAELLHADDVDGALVGGASLTAAKFLPIIAAAG